MDTKTFIENLFAPKKKLKNIDKKLGPRLFNLFSKHFLKKIKHQKTSSVDDIRLRKFEFMMERYTPTSYELDE